MGSSFFELCVRRPVLTIMMSAALMVFGAVSLSRLPVRELPDADPIIVNILTLYPGASAEVVESEITQRVEEAIGSAAGIKQILSESREEGSVINVEFIQGTDEDVAAQEVRDRVARVRGLLPDDCDEPIVAKQDASARPIIWVAFFSDRFDTQELSRIAEEQVKDRLQTVPGVSQVILGGEKRWAMRIWLDSARMAARGVAVLDVERALRTQSVDLPSGRVENRDRELTIQTRGQLRSPEEFNRLIIRQDGNSVVRLRDIGHAEEGVEDERVVARFRGKPSIGLGIVRQSRANTLEVVHDPAAVELESDAIKVRQVLLNLLSNAAKFTESGVITLRVVNEARAGVDGVLFAVSDTGIGIPADRIGELFKPFTQVDASTTRLYGGTGLGLAICRSFAERLGGTLTVESELGVGSTFALWLPRRHADAPPPALAEASPA